MSELADVVYDLGQLKFSLLGTALTCIGLGVGCAIFAHQTTEQIATLRSDLAAAKLVNEQQSACLRHLAQVLEWQAAADSVPLPKVTEQGCE